MQEASDPSSPTPSQSKAGTSKTPRRSRGDAGEGGRDGGGNRSGPGPVGAPKGWTEDHLREALDAAGVALWSWDIDTDKLSLEALGFELWGIAPDPDVCFADLSEHIHPADRDRVGAAFLATLGITGPYEIDFRIMLGDEIRWISARGHGNEARTAGRVMYGVFLDVSGRKQAEEGHELLAGEMSHRVKNLLAIATALTSITSKSTTSPTEMANELTGRLTALGRAHDLVRPLPGAEGKAALLGDLLTILLAPYDDLGAFSGRIRVAVPRMGVGESAATQLALIIHELATNSLKYGALSAETGTLDLSCPASPDEVVLVWTERGGPAVTAPPPGEGYGSQLLKRIVGGHFRGTLDYQWDIEGAVVTLALTKHRLAV